MQAILEKGSNSTGLEIHSPIIQRALMADRLAMCLKVLLMSILHDKYNSIKLEGGRYVTRSSHRTTLALVDRMNISARLLDEFRGQETCP